MNHQFFAHPLRGIPTRATGKGARSHKFLGLILMATFAVCHSHAASFSFTGNFAMDDELRYFTFDLAATSTVTLRTLGYAGSSSRPGGTNAAGNTIAGGGFDPVLSLFGGLLPDASLLASSNDGGCALSGSDAATGNCWDSHIEFANLGPGSYTVVLSQFDNLPGALLSDPFVQAGNGNFTGPGFLGSPGSFVDATPSQRSSAWALDILSVNNAVDVAASTGVPEPGSFLLVGGSWLALMAGRRLRSK